MFAAVELSIPLRETDDIGAHTGVRGQHLTTDLRGASKLELGSSQDGPGHIEQQERAVCTRVRFPPMMMTMIRYALSCDVV